MWNKKASGFLEYGLVYLLARLFSLIHAGICLAIVAGHWTTYIPVWPNRARTTFCNARTVRLWKNSVYSTYWYLLCWRSIYGRCSSAARNRSHRTEAQIIVLHSTIMHLARLSNTQHAECTIDQNKPMELLSTRHTPSRLFFSFVHSFIRFSRMNISQNAFAHTIAFT